MNATITAAETAAGRAHDAAGTAHFEAGDYTAALAEFAAGEAACPVHPSGVVTWDELRRCVRQLQAATAARRPAQAPAAPAYATSSTAIRVTDFNRNTADPNRRLWTAGQMRHVVDALGAEPVAIITDTQTGCTEVGVRLVGVSTSLGGYPTVVIERAGGTRCSFNLFSIGETILPLTRDGADAKWTAVDTMRRESSEAIRIARAEHGDAAGRQYGTWETTAQRQGVSVRYTPSKRPPAGKSAGTAWTGHVQGGKVTSSRVSHRPAR